MSSSVFESFPVNSLDMSLAPQTKSCSSFPERLRLSFRPDKIFCAGEVKFISTGNVFGDWHRAGLCPVPCLLQDIFLFWEPWHPDATAWEDSCPVLTDVSVNIESSPSMYCTTLRGLRGTSTLFSAAKVDCCGWGVSTFWESLCVRGSGEELRLLSALPVQPLSEAAGCLAARPGWGSLVPGLWWR